MTPYYQDESVTLYHGDCLKVLAELATPLAAVITDPPYASGTRHETGKPSSGAMLRGQRWSAKPIENDQMTTTGFVWLIREVCYAVRPLLIDGGHVLSFIDWRQWPSLVGAVESTNLRVNNMVIWDKGSYGLGNGFRVQHELILHASQGTPRIISRGVPNVLRVKRVDNDIHPSPKPVGLIQSLLEVTTEPGEMVLDCFAGSGATLMAAKLMGRRAIGIEVSEVYAEAAARRLSQSVLPLEVA